MQEATLVCREYDPRRLGGGTFDHTWNGDPKGYIRLTASALASIGTLNIEGERLSSDRIRIGPYVLRKLPHDEDNWSFPGDRWVREDQGLLLWLRCAAIVQWRRATLRLKRGVIGTCWAWGAADLRDGDLIAWDAIHVVRKAQDLMRRLKARLAG